MQKYWTVTNATWSAAINLSTAINKDFRLDSITIHFDVAPTTSENLTVTIDSWLGIEYDVVLFTIDPSSSSVTDIVFIPDSHLALDEWDQILVEYTNTDTATYGVRIMTQTL